MLISPNIHSARQWHERSASRVHQFRGKSAVVAREATAAIELCKEHGFVHYLAMAMILSGWASAQQGEFDKGIAEF